MDELPSELTERARADVSRRVPSADFTRNAHLAQEDQAISVDQTYEVRLARRDELIVQLNIIVPPDDTGAVEH